MDETRNTIEDSRRAFSKNKKANEQISIQIKHLIMPLVLCLISWMIALMVLLKERKEHIAIVNLFSKYYSKGKSKTVDTLKLYFMYFKCAFHVMICYVGESK